MSEFKNTTKTVSGHRDWNGSAIQPRAEVFPSNGNRIQGNAAVQRDNPPTRELQDHGGRTPLTSGYAKGGHAKHFHVHKHFHAKGGKVKTKSQSYRSVERTAEGFAEGGHVHDCTEVPAGGPDYKRGGRTLVKKNAGGALYATGGTVNRLAGGGMPIQGAPPVGGLGPHSKPPQGMPVRPNLPMRRPVAMPGPQPLMRAEGGKVGMRKVAKQEVAKHVRRAPPRGHGVK